MKANYSIFNLRVTYDHANELMLISSSFILEEQNALYLLYSCIPAGWKPGCWVQIFFIYSTFSLKYFFFLLRGYVKASSTFLG